MTRHRKQIRIPQSDDPILLMDAPVGIATTPAGDLVAVILIVAIAALVCAYFGFLK